MSKVTVFVVNKAVLICNLLSVVLQQEPDLEVVGTATAVDDAIAQAEACDVMLVDAELPDNGGLKLATEVGRKRPDTHVVVTGIERAPATILKYIEAGASGYILKEFSLEEMVAQIRALPEGKAFADPEIVAELIERLSDLAEQCSDEAGLQTKLETLSPREGEVLDLLCDGKTNAEIAQSLHIEAGTVKNHVHSILKKLGVSNRQEAARLVDETHDRDAT